LEGKDHDWILANLGSLQDAIGLMMTRVRERQSLLR
jgi:hypothetical protein